MYINIVKSFLKAQEWQFSQVEDKNIILFGISGENGKFQCIADIIEEENKKFVFFSVYGANITVNKTPEILELLNELNCSIFFGNFELDTEEGEIRFRTNLPFDNIELSQDLVTDIVMSNINAMDTSLVAIHGLIYDNLSVEEALKRIELNK